MSLKKKSCQSIALALVGVTTLVPILGSVSAMNKNIETNVNSSIKNIDVVDKNLKIGESVEVSDQDLIQILLDAGLTEKDLKESGFYSRYKSGVNKVVRVSNGYNVYLSQNTLKAIKKGGNKVLANVLANMVGGALSKLLALPLETALNKLTPNPKGGMIFKLRIKKVYMGQYEGWVEMFVLDSYVYQ
ncbi:Uncharacterised protein [[Clostridium] sordellii]|uniref:hypothetical protein n=1 Tax=Paraclostridium sordellii TaxID=1505 RepID=UPI0005E4ECAF|nr:hypothetical protein [Paeniclostridium sordellii]CEP46599.1 Uncharacterised protein [[Clostridium] sordellii] [Paeniclostridium sordellii]